MSDETTAMHELRQTVQEFHVTVAKLAVTVEGLAATVAALTASSVSQIAFSGLAEKVKDNDRDSRDRDKVLTNDVAANAKNWARLAWFICLAVAGGVLGLLFYTGGTRP